MRFYRTILERPLGVITSCLSLVILGAVALAQSPVNLLARTEHPVLTITTELADTGPQEIETLITRRMEETMADIPGLKKMSAISSAGESQVTLQFHHGQEISDAALEVRNRLRRLFPLLPSDTRFPVITRYDPSALPLLALAVSGGATPEETAMWVNRVLKPTLSRIDGVASVRVAGAPRPQILVECDTGRLRALSLTVNDVASAINAGHYSLPAGVIKSSDRQWHVRVAGNLETADAVSAHPLGVSEHGALLTVGSLAKVSRTSEDSQEITRYNGKPLITLAVYRATDADLRTVRHSLKAGLAEVLEGSDGRFQAEEIFNQAEELETVFARLKYLLPLTAASVTLVIFLFIGNLGPTFVVMAAIPFSALTAVLFMNVIGVALDPMSLGGLTLGLGIFVDNAIVVVDSISRKWSEGLSRADGVWEGTVEVAPPLALSTLTAVAVFLPVTLVSSQARLFFVGFSWTVAISLVTSLVAAIVLIPALFRISVRPREDPRAQPAIMSRLGPYYDSLLNYSQTRPGVILAVAGSFLAFGALLSTGLVFRHTALVDTQAYRIFMVLPPGTVKALTADKAVAVERDLTELPGARGVYTEITRNQAVFTLTMKKGNSSQYTAQELLNRIRSSSVGDKSAQFHVMPLGEVKRDTKISLNFHASSHHRLTELHERLRGLLMSVPGIQDVLVRQGNPVPIAEFRLDHSRTGFNGVRGTDVAHHIRAHFTGPVAAKIFEGERIVQVRVRALRHPVAGFESLTETVVPTERRGMVPIEELSRPGLNVEPNQLHRENRRPVLKMTALVGSDNPLGVADRIHAALEGKNLPVGVEYSFGEDVQEILSTRREMLLAGVFALCLIYLLLTLATESLLYPILIMMAIPFAGAGAVFALRAFSVPVSLPVCVGLMILAGLTINVNVVMTYTIRAIRDKGLRMDASIREAARRRLRPIVMTLMTTVGSSLPMILDRSAGSDMWFPFALTLASGAFAATLFALILTPTLYGLLANMRQREVTG
jgi:HAE1 family hydrophobic/amphiphilic exporter-1